MKTCYVDYATRSIADLVDSREMGLRNGMVITRINVPRESRGKGHGTKLLKQIIDDADAEGVNLYLEILSSGGLSRGQLEAWYLRHGFERVGGVYCRKPKKLGEEMCKCLWCGDWFDSTGSESGAHYPYCSSLCSAHAEADSEEDERD